MFEYRYNLERGGSKHICPACGQRRFVRYVDTETGEYLADEVGRCDREDSCSYHLRPSEYFQAGGLRPAEASGLAITRKPAQELEPSFIPLETMQASFRTYGSNNFCRWLCGVFGEEKALELSLAYRIGTSKHWPGACVFWQIDEAGRIRAGKIMLYNPETGRRVRETGSRTTWVHSVLKIEPFHLRQCLFGLHLVAADCSKPVAVVESEKTAVVASGFIPDFAWTATGGKKSRLREKLLALDGREVVLFPDLGGFDDWKQMAAGIPGVRVSSVLEDRATAEDRAAGLDVADYLLRDSFGDVRAVV